MILRQTWAILLDQYRELSAKRLFWITMALSLLVVALYGSFGINERGLTFFAIQFETSPFDSNTIPPNLLYTFVFANLAVPIWLTWIATILALVSTASIIPDFIAGGSVELALSKPISRWRLLLTKFASGLLFVTLQVGVFSLASFIVIGLRGNTWEWGIFLAIPIVVTFFSYLFCVAVLFGLLTRSTLASLLLTGLFWVLLFGLNVTDGILLQTAEARRLEVDIYERRVELREQAAVNAWREQLEAGAIEGDPANPPQGEDLHTFNTLLAGAREQLEGRRESFEGASTWARRIELVKTVLPKTSETIDQLNQNLISLEQLERFTQLGNDDEDGPVDESVYIDRQAQRLQEIRLGMDNSNAVLTQRVQERLRGRSTLWVIGTSLIFEAFILGLCCLIFTRRDF